MTPERPSTNRKPKTKTFLLKCLVILLSIWISIKVQMLGAAPLSGMQSSDQYEVKNKDPEFPHAMFYNIFIPKVKLVQTDQKLTFVKLINEILDEQLSQVNTYLTSNERITRGQIFYNLIDTSGYFNQTNVEQICSKYDKLGCTMAGHHEQGNEYLTLSLVHDYCKKIEDKSTRVSYFHSKGTYHPGDINKNWRYFLLKAMLDRDCLQPPDSSCNVCGLQFYPFWSTLFPGNFWTAECSMIEKLLPPVQYEQELGTIVKQISNSGKFSTQINKFEGWSVGIGRYAAELWVGSHPDLRPCDMSQDAQVRTWMEDIHTVSTGFSFASGVRHPLSTPRHMMREDGFSEVIANETRRKNEFFFLPGLLVRWYALYRRFPPEDSWVWDFYPDGDYWKERVIQSPDSWMQEYASIRNQSIFVKEWEGRKPDDTQGNAAWSQTIREKTPRVFNPGTIRNNNKVVGVATSTVVGTSNITRIQPTRRIPSTATKQKMRHVLPQQPRFKSELD